MNPCHLAIIAIALTAIGMGLRVAALRNQGVRITLPEMAHNANGRKSGKEYADTYEEMN